MKTLAQIFACRCFFTKKVDYQKLVGLRSAHINNYNFWKNMYGFCSIINLFVRENYSETVSSPEKLHKYYLLINHEQTYSI